MSMYHDDDFDLEIDTEDELEADEALTERPRPTLDETLRALRGGEGIGLTATIYYGLSDLEPGQVEELESIWEALSPDYRLKIVQQLVDISETNFDLDYQGVGWMALEDSDGDVRAAAIELLWPDESSALMRKLLDLAVDDDAAAVRAQAASALGRFILLGEFEEIPAEQANAAVDTAISIYNDVDEDVEVRRRALEALGHSSHAGVEDLIREAYESHEQLMKVSAVFAMGKSCDPKWVSIVTREMNSGDAELRFEAARAAGELGLEEAVPKLSRLAYEPDREVKEAAIWALGEIGGHEAQRVLEALIHDPAVAADEDLQEALDDALAAATLPGSLTLFEIDEESGEEVEIEFDYSDDDDYELWDDEDDDRSRLN